MHKGSLRAGILLFLEEMQRLHGGMTYKLDNASVDWPGYGKKTWMEVVGRMVEAGELVEQATTIGLTKKGREELWALQPVRVYRDDAWDGVWRVVTFEIPEKKRVKRNQLRTYLLELGFGLWQRSLYVSAYPLLDVVREYTKHLGVEQLVADWQFSMKKKHDNQRLIDEAYNIEGLREAYLILLEHYRGSSSLEGKGLEKKQRVWMKDWQKLMFEDALHPKELRDTQLASLRQQSLQSVEAMIFG
jgi:DNA-binding transcriptional regulator PaaX